MRKPLSVEHRYPTKRARELADDAIDALDETLDDEGFIPLLTDALNDIALGHAMNVRGETPPLPVLKESNGT